MCDQAIEPIGNLYPKVALPKTLGKTPGTVVAWIWSRTVPSPDPAYSGVAVPIAANFLLSAKKGKEVWIKPVVDKKGSTIRYEIVHGGSKEDIESAKAGTKAGRGANFRCLLSGTAITPEYVKKCGLAGLIKQQLIAIAVDAKGGKIYLPPNSEHEDIALSAKPVRRPDTALPNDPRNFWTIDYGLTTFGDLFTARQLVSLTTLSALVHEARDRIERDAIAAGMVGTGVALRDGGNGAKAYAEAISVYLAFAVDRAADFNNSLTGWRPGNEKIMYLFNRQSIPMAWDFGEANILADVVGGFPSIISYQSKCVATLAPRAEGTIVQLDAQGVDYQVNTVVSTDPPYYDNIAYADLSDFFYVWIKSALTPVYPQLFGYLQTPKTEELVASPYRHGGKDNAEQFFLEGMSRAIQRIASHASDLYPTTIYYAFKQSEVEKEGIISTGWATFLQAVLNAGFQIQATWPVRSEQTVRMIASGTNALATSVVLACRPRAKSADTVTRAEFIRALQRELPVAIKELQSANISPADMPQSATGRGIGIFSRYGAVLESDDRRMTVKAALQLINRELDEYLGVIQGEFDPETRFAITWFEQHGTAKGDYGTANNIAQARGISVDSVKHAGIVESSAGKVRVLKRDEMERNWDPATDTHLTIWECCQYLTRTLENEGEYAAAVLLKRMGSERAEAVKDLAYCLYDVCSNKRKDAKEATSYNALIAVWTDLTRLAATIQDTRGDGQLSMAI